MFRGRLYRQRRRFHLLQARYQCMGSDNIPCRPTRCAATHTPCAHSHTYSHITALRVANCKCIGFVCTLPVPLLSSVPCSGNFVDDVVTNHFTADCCGKTGHSEACVLTHQNGASGGSVTCDTKSGQYDVVAAGSHTALPSTRIRTHYAATWHH